jgi:VanZ family protein
MLSFVNNRKVRLMLAFAYLVFITLLFCLPGSAFPKETWFTKIQLDKWLHVAVFGLLAIAFYSVLVRISFKRVLFMLFLMTLYGFVIEVIQGLYVENRSFDMMDLLADFLGAAAGILFSRRYIKK